MSDTRENFNSQCVKALKIVLHFSYITTFNATNFLMIALSVGTEAVYPDENAIKRNFPTLALLFVLSSSFKLIRD